MHQIVKKRPLDSWFQPLLAEPFGFKLQVNDCSIPVSLSDDGDAFYLKAELPGVARDSIQVEIKGAVVSINATYPKADTNSVTPSVDKNESSAVDNERVLLCDELHQGVHTRVIKLADEVDSNKVTAQLESGVLSLMLPRKKETKRTQIIIQ